MKTLHTHLVRFTKLTLLCLSLLMLPSQSLAEDVTFSWTANPEPYTGYKLYYKTGADSAPPYDGTGLNEGNSPILLGKVSTFTATGLSPYETYHFVLTAYSDTEESDYSAIVTIQPDTVFPSPTINIMSQN